MMEALDDGERFGRMKVVAQKATRDPALQDSATISYVNEFAAFASYRAGDLSEGLNRIRLAIRYAGSRDHWSRLNLRRTLAIFLLNSRHHEEALATLRDAAPLADSLDGHEHVRAEYHLTTTASYLVREFEQGSGAWENGLYHLKRTHQLLDEVEAEATDPEKRGRIRRQRALITSYRAGFASLEGRFGQVEDYLQEARQQTASFDSSRAALAITEIGWVRAHIVRHVGRTRAALRILDRIVQFARSRDVQRLMPALLSLRVAVAAEAGEDAVARSSLRALGHLDVAGAAAHYHHASVHYGDHLRRLREDAAPWRAVSAILALLTLLSLGVSFARCPSGFVHWRAFGLFKGSGDGDSSPSSPASGNDAGDGDTGGPEDGNSGGRGGGSDPPNDAPASPFGDPDGWALSSDSGGAPPDDLDVRPGDPPSRYTPDRLAPRIPTADRPPPPLRRPVVVVERYSEDGDMLGLVGLPAWTVEDVLRDGLFLLDRGDRLTLVLRLRDSTRTVVRDASRAGVSLQRLPFRVVGLPIAEIQFGSTLSG
jgi:hypothetical protein